MEWIMWWKFDQPARTKALPMMRSGVLNSRVVPRAKKQIPTYKLFGQTGFFESSQK